MYKEIRLNNTKISFYGSKQAIEDTERKVKVLIKTNILKGDEIDDRLIIQMLLDENKGMATVLYNGNTVYPAKKIIAELDRMRKSNSIEKITNTMYKFLSGNFDIAHYDKQGYIAYYNGEYNRMMREIRPMMDRTPRRMSDIWRILDTHFKR